MNQSPTPQFGDLEPQFTNPQSAKAIILPVPYDLTSTWKKGADRAPTAILEASTQIELYDIETQTEPYHHGIATLPPITCNDTPDILAKHVEQAVTPILNNNQLPVLLGGEHSISIGAFYAAAKHTPNLSILQIDAHGDTRESYHDSTHNHACVMARAREHAKIVQVGIRAIDISETEKINPDQIVYAHQIMDGTDPNRNWIDRVLNQLTDNVYITIDLDAFDPSLLPATGTPEPGGLGWYDVDALLKATAQSKNIIGFDVVELLPHPAHWASDFIAAKLIYRTLALLFKHQNQ